jgi:hypothetical protein
LSKWQTCTLKFASLPHSIGIMSKWRSVDDLPPKK